MSNAPILSASSKASPCDHRMWDQLPRVVFALLLSLVAPLGLAASPVAAQDLETFDPDEGFSEALAAVSSTVSSAGAIDADLAEAPTADAGPLPVVQPLPAGEPSRGFEDELAIYSDTPAGAGAASQGTAATNAQPSNSDLATESATASANTFAEDDLIGAAEGVFGKGAKGIAKMIENLLKKEGQPNGYIVGREAGGAFIVGARYGSGTLHHKIEGERKVYWTGPSVGFDAGANAANTFVLVYNLWDSEDLFKRFPAGEGQAYLIGGLHASYVRRGDVVLIPIRMGAGVRLGVNAGYMKFSKKQRWLPF